MGTYCIGLYLPSPPIGCRGSAPRHGEGSPLWRQLADPPHCLAGSQSTRASGLQVRQRRTISLGTGLSRPADQHVAGQRSSSVARQWPLSTRSNSPIGHATGTLPAPYHLGATRSLKVVTAAQQPDHGRPECRCRSAWLLHFAAARAIAPGLFVPKPGCGVLHLADPVRDLFLYPAKLGGCYREARRGDDSHEGTNADLLDAGR